MCKSFHRSNASANLIRNSLIENWYFCPNFTFLFLRPNELQKIFSNLMRNEVVEMKSKCQKLCVSLMRAMPLMIIKIVSGFNCKQPKNLRLIRTISFQTLWELISLLNIRLHVKPQSRQKQNSIHIKLHFREMNDTASNLIRGFLKLSTRY